MLTLVRNGIIAVADTWHRGAPYRVIPGFEVAGKRIDLAVGDGQPRLAIECDGDRWHGPDQYDADMVRQRRLERCGWQFIRVRASAFYSNRPKAVHEIVEAIRGHGLEPHNTATGEVADCDWVQEVSGAECLADLQASGVKTEPSNSARQKGFFDEEREDNSAEIQDSKDVDSAEKAVRSQSDVRKSKAKTEKAPPEKPSPKAATSTSDEERTTVQSALKKSKQPLGVTLLSIDADVKKLRLVDQRLKEILRVLEKESLVTRHDTPKGPRYSAR